MHQLEDAPGCGATAASRDRIAELCERAGIFFASRVREDRDPTEEAKDPGDTPGECRPCQMQVHVSVSILNGSRKPGLMHAVEQSKRHAEDRLRHRIQGEMESYVWNVGYVITMTSDQRSLHSPSFDTSCRAPLAAPTTSDSL